MGYLCYFKQAPSHYRASIKIVSPPPTHRNLTLDVILFIYFKSNSLWKIKNQKGDDLPNQQFSSIAMQYVKIAKKKAKQQTKILQPIIEMETHQTFP